MNTNETVTCWKVVRIGVNGKLYSCSVPFPHAIRYFKSKWTKAEVGGLLVFDDPNKAINYSNMTDEVYECQCRGHVPLPSYRCWLASMINISPKRIARLWKIFGYKYMNCAYTPGWLSGSMAFREIKLTKCIKKGI